MTTYTPPNLLKLWKLEQLPQEMAIGHILQNLVTMQETIDILRRAVTQLGATVSVSSTQPGEERLTYKGKQKTSKPDNMPDSEQLI